jgi:hypothetical protein
MPLPGGGRCVAFAGSLPVVLCGGDGFLRVLELRPGALPAGR